MTEAIQSYLLQHWEKIFPGQKKPERLTFLQIAQSQGRALWRGRVNLLFWKDRDTLPSIVAKFYTSPRGNGLLEHEYHRLRLLHATLKANVTPQPLGLTVIGDTTVYLEQYLAGISIRTELQNFIHSPLFELSTLRQLITQHFDVAASIIVKFNSLNQAVDDGAAEQELNRMADTSLQLMECKDDQRALIKNITHRIGKILLRQPNHHRITAFDFVPQNILLDEHRNARMIDWEYADDSSLLFLEPTKFIFHYLTALWSCKIFRGSLVEFFDATFQPDHWLFPPIAKFINGVIPATADLQPAEFRQLFLPYLLFEFHLQHTVANQPRVCVDHYQPLILYLGGLIQPANKNVQIFDASRYRLTEKEICEAERVNEEEVVHLKYEILTTRAQLKEIMESRSFKLATRISNVKKIIWPVREQKDKQG